MNNPEAPQLAAGCFTDRLPKDALEECGRLLGIYEDGVLTLNSKDETAVLMDYCIYDWRQDGRNVVERYVAETPVEAGSNEKALLDAMVEARYSLFAVDEVVDGLGVETHDLLRGDSGFIRDVALSKTAIKDSVLAGRIITPEGCAFSMTTGAALPMDHSTLRRIVRELPERFGKTTADLVNLSPEKSAELSAFLTRLLIESGASSRIAYEDSVAEERPKAKPKVGRNAPRPCGSGKKYKRCCGQTAAAPVEIPDHRLMERDLRGLQRLLEGQDFGSVDEMNAYLRELTTEGKVPEWVPQTPLERAQELVYGALEAKERKERIRLAIEAINTCKDCADAYVLLAEEEAETLERALDWYGQGVEAAERALGPQVFQDDVGRFWGIMETRPYMRAREGLADCLALLGEGERAVNHYREMLRLNPNDNQGIRYKLLACLVTDGDVDGSEQILADYEGDDMAAWVFTRALVRFLREGASARARLAVGVAMGQNPHVVSYLLGRRRLPRQLPDFISPGQRNEAVAYVADFGKAWAKAPGALKWLASLVPGR